MERFAALERSPKEIVSEYALFLKAAYGQNSKLQKTLDRKRLEYVGNKSVGAFGDKDRSRRNTVKATYDAIAPTYMMGRKVQTEQEIMRWLLEQEVKDTETISIGSGPAPQEIFLKKIGVIKKEVKLLDFSHLMLEVARKVANENGIKGIEFLEEDVVDADLQEEQFGQAFLIGSLNWIGISDGRKVLEKVLRALRPGGEIFTVHTNYPLPNSFEIPDFALKMALENLGAQIIDLKTEQIGEDMPRVYVHARKREAEIIPKRGVF